MPKLRPHIEGDGKGLEPYLSAARLECRAVDPAMNPYLGAAMMLAAGLDGIENDLDAGDPIDENMYLLSDAQLSRKGVKQLPRTLLEAIEAFADPLGKQVMGKICSARRSSRPRSDGTTRNSQWELLDLPDQVLRARHVAVRQDDRA